MGQRQREVLPQAATVAHDGVQRRMGPAPKSPREGHLAHTDTEPQPQGHLPRECPRDVAIKLTAEHYYNDAVTEGRHFTLADLGLAYTWRKVRLTLDWTNILGARLYSSGDALRPRRLAQLLRHTSLSHNAEGAIQALLIRIARSHRRMKDTISMKSIALYALLLSLGLSLSSRAQSPIGSIHPFDIRKYTVLDSANYRIDYKTTCLLDPKKHDKVTNEMYLLVGRKISKFGHVCVLDNQQELIAAESQEAGPGIEARGMGGMEVYKYLSGTKPYSELTFRLFIYYYRYTLIYSDELHPQSWTLTDEHKDVLGYFTDQKATARFRGRDYTAWVATEYPHL